MGWKEDGIAAVRAGNAGDGVTIGLSALFPAIEACEGPLLELDAACESVDGPRMRRAYGASIPRLLDAFFALFICTGALALKGLGKYNEIVQSDEQIAALAKLNEACRGKGGAMLFFVRAMQADTLQARKLFLNLEQTWDAVDEPGGTERFHKAIFFSVGEVDSVIVTLRCLGRFLPPR